MSRTRIAWLRPGALALLISAAGLTAAGPGAAAPPTTGNACRDARLRILQPRQGATVGERPIVQGTAPAPDTEVWLVVRPMALSDYWVQSVTPADEQCRWRIQARIGRPGQDVGQRFQVMAVVGARPEVREGQVLPGWPQAAQRSQMVEVIRGR
jgi:hypothetical protein